MNNISLIGLIETIIKASKIHSIFNLIPPGWGILHNDIDASNERIWMIWDKNCYDIHKLQTSS